MNGESHGDHHPGDLSRYTAITRVRVIIRVNDFFRV